MESNGKEKKDMAQTAKKQVVKKETKKVIYWDTEKKVLLGIGIFFLIVALIMSLFGFIGYYLNRERLVETQKILVDIAKQINENNTAIAKDITVLKSKQKETTNKSTTPKISVGFTPDKGLIDIRNQVKFPKIPKNLEPYKKFFDVKGAWGEPRGGFYFCYNDAFLDVDRLGNVQIPTFSCLTFTGEEMYLPGIGSLKDPNGGAVEANIINVWETPGEFVRAYLLHGYFMVGQMFDMSDMTFDKDGKPVYGEYTLESLASLRNHFLYHLTTVDKEGFNFIGQTGKASQADSVTYVCVIRWYDGSFLLVDSGQWVRSQ